MTKTIIWPISFALWSTGRVLSIHSFCLCNRLFACLMDLSRSCRSGLSFSLSLSLPCCYVLRRIVLRTIMATLPLTLTCMCVSLPIGWREDRCVNGSTNHNHKSNSIITVYPRPDYTINVAISRCHSILIWLWVFVLYIYKYIFLCVPCRQWIFSHTRQCDNPFCFL